MTRDITNLGKGRYRNDVLVGIDYETDIDRARRICDEVLEALTADRTNDIDGYHPTTVKDFEDSQIRLAVKIWVEEPRPMVINGAQTTVLSAIQSAFAAEGISIPFPQRTISDRGDRWGPAGIGLIENPANLSYDHAEATTRSRWFRRPHRTHPDRRPPRIASSGSTPSGDLHCSAFS